MLATNGIFNRKIALMSSPSGGTGRFTSYEHILNCFRVLDEYDEENDELSGFEGVKVRAFSARSRGNRGRFSRR